MTKRGFSTNILLVIFGVVVIAGVLVYSNLNPSSDSTAEIVPDEEKVASSDSAVPEVKPIAEKPTVGFPKPTAPPMPNIPLPLLNPTSPSSSVSEPSTPPPALIPTPTPVSQVPYSPNFQATTRITPEIPSENERAMLPSCEGKTFNVDPVQLSIVTSVIPTGSMHGSGVSDYAIFKVVGNGELNKYDIIAPGDVYITHITQENGLSADPEDNTIYFALCKDVIGYVTHVKELSTSMYKMVTDSVCLGKPHVGPNACLIQKLELISRGVLLGKVGRLEGSFGFGVIDLRTEPRLPNASQYSVKTNFAACPLAYLANSAGFYGKLVNTNTLCPSQ